MTRIIATSVAFPPYYYKQEELTAALRQVWAAKQANVARLDSFHQNVAVRGRYLALPIESYADLDGFGARNDEWIRSALDLGETAICELLNSAGLPPQQITYLAFTTITGVAVPSIDARLMNRIAFPSRLKRSPLFGLGCLGGAAGVARVADYLDGHPVEAAVLLAIELCSLTIQRQDVSVANLVSSALFGDGGAAVLLVGDNHPLARPGLPQVVDTRSVFFPESEHVMGWKVLDSGFKIVLSADVAEIARHGLRAPLSTFLSGHGLEIADIAYWIVHPGGPKVIQSIEEGLDLRHGALDLSRETLAEVGNVSSVSALLILDRVLASRQASPGSWGLMMAMGPAFCAELVLLRW